MARKRKYARVQLDYLAAKEQFLHTAKNTDKHLEQLRSDGAQEIGEIEMGEAIGKSGFHRAFNELTQAENRLIEWSHWQIKQEPIYLNNIDKYERLFQESHTNQDSRAVIVHLAMELQVNS